MPTKDSKDSKPSKQPKAVPAMLIRDSIRKKREIQDFQSVAAFGNTKVFRQTKHFKYFPEFPGYQQSTAIRCSEKINKPKNSKRSLKLRGVIVLGILGIQGIEGTQAFQEFQAFVALQAVQSSKHSKNSKHSKPSFLMEFSHLSVVFFYRLLYEFPRIP
jgi:hypothetical protein